MRILLLACLLWLFLIVACPGTCLGYSRFHDHDAPRLHKRQGALAAKSILDAQVPDRLKDWDIFKDGNGIREGFRKGYTAMLRQLDKVREPYSFSRATRKVWIYKPDLRKQYIIPRVLRVPAILQDGPVPYDQEFAAHIKSSDEEFKTKEAAREHVTLKGDSEAEATKSAAKEAEKVKPRKSTRGKKRMYKKGLSFNQFLPSSPRDSTAPSSPAHPIESDFDEPTVHSSRSQTLSPTKEEQTVGEHNPLHSDVGQAQEQSVPVARLTSKLVEMKDRFDTLQQFQRSQLKKAAMRYPGHPDYFPPEQQSAAGYRDDLALEQQSAEFDRNLEAERARLPRIRVRKSASQDVHADPQPRRAHDPADDEADVSNPITPNYDYEGSHFGDTWSPHKGSHHRFRSFDNPEFQTPGNSPSPVVSPYEKTGIKSVSTSAANTPRSFRMNPDTGNSPPGRFRLPANYADLLHNTRVQMGIPRVHHSILTPSFAHASMTPEDTSIFQPPVFYASSGAEESSARPQNIGWEDDIPSVEGIQKMQEAAKLNNVDYAIYPESTPYATEGSALQPVHWEDEQDGLLPLDMEPDGASSGGSRQAFGGGDTDLDLPAKTWQQTVAAGDSLPRSLPYNEVEEHETSSDIISSPPEAPAKKRFRPLALNKLIPNNPNFLFQASQNDLATPHLEGFKPSLQINEDPNPQYNPIDADSSLGRVSRGLKLKQLIRKHWSKLRSMRAELRNMEPTKEYIIQAYRKNRAARQAARDGDAPASSLPAQP
ncbi:uncharacterized protein MEPE_01530 [Melanopsichium pennsylvanicum]|uniref:Uncharacterized protein n=2 Tax=Melanopsichium pennsylvanicum TaxID=63383 RepID=A0AAJ4XHS4_9BASI|nr:putative protein [Melanopsichium pennsylvanicum 4]SNX82824.1 uncharacterized protein MEPE_01530 [Melanopsichium pennsylvanicum]